MSKLARQTFLQFGSTPGTNQVEQFGSLALGSPNFTTNIATLQSLSAWLEGWSGAVVGSGFPAYQDMNAVCIVFAYMLAYLFQEGIPEWDSGTTYYTGSLVQDGTGIIYKSLQNSNLNNALSSATFWARISPSGSSQTFTKSGTFTAPSGVTQVQVTAVQSAPISMGNVGIFAGNAQFFGLLDINQKIWTIGSGSSGELGNGIQENVSSPVQVVGSSNFIEFFGGGVTQFALDNGGNIWSWGNNLDGQLGNGTNLTPVSSPVLVLGQAQFRKICTFGTDEMVAALDWSGNLWTWGENFNGQLGNGNTTSQSSPVLVLGSHTFAKAKVFGTNTGGISVAAIDTSGQLWTWGLNKDGQLGNGNTTPQSSPVAVLGSHVFVDVWGAVSATTGYSSMLALDSNGALWAWGGNAQGQLGNGNPTSQSSPVQVLGSLNVAGAIVNPTAAPPWVLALDTTGHTWGWGYNSSGQLGNGNTTSQSSPVLVLGTHTFTQLKLGPFSSYAIDQNGALWAWGANVDGQLGNGNTTAQSSPVAVLGGISFAYVLPSFQIQATLGVDISGQVWGWGVNAIGQLGNGTQNASSSPVMVLGGPNKLVQLSNKQQTFQVPVVAGQTYSVTFGMTSYFAGNPVGNNIDTMVVNY